MKTKDDIISIVDATVAAYNNSPVWYKEDVKRYMEHYAQLKLSEHSTKEQEVVAYMVNSIKHIGNNYYDADYLTEEIRQRMINAGYAITPLVKKTV